MSAATPLSPSFAQQARNPDLFRYGQLVSVVATRFEGRDEGLYDVKQLAPLTNAERGLILRCNPDLLNGLHDDAEQLAEVLEGTVSPGLYLSAKLEPLLRKQLFEDVCAEIERDAELLRQSSFDPEDVT
jgi:hypothetical protein